MSWDTNRTQPYTEQGIKRLDCLRCGMPARFQWQICADGNRYRPICDVCDIALNELVLEFMLHPDALQLAKKYRERVLA